MKHPGHCLMAVLLFFCVGCGPQHKARTLVDDFMEANLIQPSDLHSVEYAKLDSTRFIGDSLIQVMRQAAEQNPHFRQPISYGTAPVPSKENESSNYARERGTKSSNPLLYITRVDYKLGDKECQDTYYLDADLTAVVAFKSIEKI